jgi:hypothetical protein
MFSGISQHSKKGNLIVFSVFNKKNTHDLNFELHESMYRQLKSNNIEFKEVRGVYKNEEELSFVTEYNFNLLNTVIVEYNQQSVLFLQNHKHGLYEATLVFKNKRENIGYFRQVDKEIAQKQDSYTRDGDNYYICTESDTTIVDELTKLGLK